MFPTSAAGGQVSLWQKCIQSTYLFNHSNPFPMHFAFRSGLLLATVLGVVACSSGDGEGSGSAVATSGADAWRITETGFGPLRAGMTVAEAASAVGGEFSVAPGAPAECSYAEWPAAPSGVRVMLVNDTVARIEVTDAAVRTESGARIGDNEGRINSLYVGRLLMMPHKYTTGKYIVVTQPEDTMHRIVFETDGQAVTEFRSGREPEVQWVERCG